MTYDQQAVSDVPRSTEPMFQYLVDTYAGEIEKTASVWRGFADGDLAYRPHPRSSTVAEIMKHQILSERRFFAEFLESPEPAASELLPVEIAVSALSDRMVKLAIARLAFLAGRSHHWWFEHAPFFDVARERIWIFWRRVLHTAHHRTQLTVYLRMLDKTVPSTYGPTADVTWKGADPTTTVEAASRK